MIAETTKYLDDYFSHQKQSYISYEKENTNITKRFTIEYCDDEKKLERVGLLKEFGGLEIDDAYYSIHFKESNRFDTFEGIVMETYIRMLFNPKICDVKLWEQIYDGDELIQERWFEFPSTFYHEISKIIAKDITESRDNLQKQVDPLTKELADYQQFLKGMNAENVFKEWKEKREVQKC